MAIKHRFTSSIVDVGGGTYIQPTHWNDDHRFPPMQLFKGGSGTWLAAGALPSAITEFRNGAGTPMRFAFDMTNVTLVRVTVNVRSGSPAFASCAVGVQWAEMDSANSGSWWGIASGGTDGAWCGVGSGAFPTTLMGIKVGTWYPVNPSAAADGWVALRLVSFMGNGSLSPGIGDISVFVL